jgi:S1-C subfamily serine protease
MLNNIKITFFISSLILTGILSSCNKGPTKFEAKEAEQGVVRIVVAFRSNTSQGYSSGSGFYIGNNIIVTNNHVIADRAKGKLVVARKHSKDSIEIQDGSVIWTDEELDIALIEVSEIKCEELTLSEAQIKKGSSAYAIGFPTSADTSRRSGSGKMGPSEISFIDLAYSSNRGIQKDADTNLVQFLDPTVSSGEIRKTTTRKWFPHFSTKLEVIDHDVNIGHGNSGGPLFDECGRVIGINTQVSDVQVNPHLALADNVKLSSNITELIKVLESQKISAQITPTPVEDILSSGTGWTTWLPLILILALVAYIFISYRKKPQSESIAQYAGRVSGYTRLHRSKDKAPSVAPQHGPRWEGGEIVTGPTAQQGAPQPTPLTHTHSWILQSDSTSPHRVQLPISDELLQQYGNNLIIGRKLGVAHLVIDNSSLSKSHAILSFRKGNFAVIDQKSANGTSINGTALNSGQRTRINSGDRLTLGEVTVIFSELS